MSTFSVSCLAFSDKKIVSWSVSLARVSVATRPSIYCHTYTQKPLVNPNTIFKHGRLASYTLTASFDLITPLSALASLTDGTYPVRVLTAALRTGRCTSCKWRVASEKRQYKDLDPAISTAAAGGVRIPYFRHNTLDHKEAAMGFMHGMWPETRKS